MFLLSRKHSNSIEIISKKKTACLGYWKVKHGRYRRENAKDIRGVHTRFSYESNELRFFKRSALRRNKMFPDVTNFAENEFVRRVGKKKKREWIRIGHNKIHVKTISRCNATRNTANGLFLRYCSFFFSRSE